MGVHQVVKPAEDTKEVHLRGSHFLFRSTVGEATAIASLPIADRGVVEVVSREKVIVPLCCLEILEIWKYWGY